MTKQNKTNLRQYTHALRKQIFNQQTLYNEACYKIQLAVIQSNLFKSATTILAYSSTKTEIKTMNIIEKAWETDKQVFFPKCRQCEDNIMDFALSKNHDDLEEGQYKILEPKNDCPIATPKMLNNTECLVLVPALAFDEKGYRLGYGKGFYDRFLSGVPLAITIGITFDTLILPNIPTNHWDIPVQYLASEKGIYKIL